MAIVLHSYAFDFRQKGTFVLATLSLGSVIRNASLVVFDAYTDPLAFVRVGLGGDPSALLRATDSDLRVAGEYACGETRLAVLAGGLFTPLVLFLSPHLSPRGFGRFYYTLEQ